MESRVAVMLSEGVARSVPASTPLVTIAIRVPLRARTLLNHLAQTRKTSKSALVVEGLEWVAAASGDSRPPLPAEVEENAYLRAALVKETARTKALEQKLQQEKARVFDSWGLPLPPKEANRVRKLRARVLMRGGNKVQAGVSVEGYGSSGPDRVGPGLWPTKGGFR